MLYLQENLRQQALANIFGTSQPLSPRRLILCWISLMWCSHPHQGRKTLGPNGYAYLMARSYHAGGGRTL